jgi:hypothetical protein
MDPKKSKPSEETDQQMTDHEEPRGTEVGGREFGQVIEPTQAQMASGNEGLVEKRETKTKRGETKAGRKKKAA